MKILIDKYLESYKKKLTNFEKKIDNFYKKSKNLDFEYLTQTSSVFSSNIE
jgi:hypothetical protein